MKWVAIAFALLVAASALAQAKAGPSAVRYDAVFAHKAAAVESAILISENGARSVIGYFIK